MKPCLVLLFAIGAFAQQPHFLNARVDVVPKNGGLAAQIRQIASSSEALWIGYTVPRIAAAGQSCCYWDDGYHSSRGCGLEANTPRPSTDAAPPRPVLLEGQSHTTILLRFEAGKLNRLRSFSLDCELDAGGLRVAWLNGVAASESLAFLNGLDEALRQSALRVMATHADPQATKLIEDAAVNSQSSESQRRNAISLLGSMRGSAGYEALMRFMARTPTDEQTERFRENAVAALGSNPDPRAADTLRGLAANDRSTRVRGQAVQGLSRKSGSANAILAVARKDADAGVRKRAVSALSRLPAAEGVPLLIELARDRNTDSVLRKEAINGLGRVKDPKAQAYLEQLLK